MTVQEAKEICLEKLGNVNEMNDEKFNSHAISFKVSPNYNLVVWCDLNTEDDDTEDRYFIVSIRYNPYDDSFGEDIYCGEYDTMNTSEDELENAIAYVFSHKDFVADNN